VVLGIILGELARAGRDKVTIAASPGISDLGAWLEQLLAESTGKEGRGLIPVDNETLGPPAAYGQDRLFAYLRLDTAPDAGQDTALEALERAGHPVVRIHLTDTLSLGEEFFRWEIATAVAGSVLGINAFNQPNVQESKDYTRELTDQYEQSGRMPSEPPILSAEGIQLFADQANAAHLAGAAPKTGFPAGSLESYLAAHLGRLQAGDYFALNAYVEMNALHQEKLQAIRLRVRDAKQVATTLGYGPRFLHSTGQLHKGGPNSGVFLQLTAADAEDLPIPGRRFSFGVLKGARGPGPLDAGSGQSAGRLRLIREPFVPVIIQTHSPPTFPPQRPIRWGVADAGSGQSAGRLSGAAINAKRRPSAREAGALFCGPGAPVGTDAFTSRAGWTRPGGCGAGRSAARGRPWAGRARRRRATCRPGGIRRRSGGR
jgi:hypothetical protein